METVFRTKQDVLLHLDAVKTASENISKAVAITMEVIRKFDGKDFTRRITNQAQKAVDEALGDSVVALSFTKTDYHFGVEFYVYDRYYMKDGCALYFDRELYKSLLIWDADVVDAAKFQATADGIVKHNAVLVYKYADAAKHFDEYRQAYAEALHTLQIACGAINPVFVCQTVHTTDSRVSMEWNERAEKAVSF